MTQVLNTPNPTKRELLFGNKIVKTRNIALFVAFFLQFQWRKAMEAIATYPYTISWFFFFLFAVNKHYIRGNFTWY